MKEKLTNLGAEKIAKIAGTVAGTIGSLVIQGIVARFTCRKLKAETSVVLAENDDTPIKEDEEKTEEEE